MESWKLLEDPAHGLVTECRPLQVDLAKYLHSAMSTETPCMVEAGTGIGKSFSYLLNAIDLAMSGKRVVISTAMKSLQQQLYFTDLPYLATKMKVPAYARQLGKKNYGCKRQVSLNVFNDVDCRAYDEFFDTVTHWVWEDAPSALTARLPQDRTMHSVAYCNGVRCDFHEECAKMGYLAARADYESAAIVVANHALVGADMRIYKQYDLQLLGSYDALVVDEAHKYPEAIRGALALQMPAGFFEKAIAKYRELMGNVHADINVVMLPTSIAHIPENLPMAASLNIQYAAMFRETRNMQTFGPQGTTFAMQTRTACAELMQTFGVGTPGYRDFLNNADNPRPCSKVHSSMRRSETLMQLFYFIDEYYGKLESFCNAIDLAVTESLRYTVSVEQNDRGVHEIKTIPIHVGDVLESYYRSRLVTPAYLSATLTVDGSFDYFARELGHDTETQRPAYRDPTSDEVRTPPPSTFLAGSPFSPKQAWCYVPEPSAVPDPSHGEEYMRAVVQECYDLLMANEGHAFILFTSFRDMEHVANGLRAKKYPYPLLVQSAALKANGRSIFMETPNATLLGTKSFWEGIDVPGLHLSLVIIPKAPFPNPSDAIVKAKTAIAGDTWFQRVSMPLMLIDLRQMAGRLIRTTSDKGVIALLDTRVHSKNYGPRMLNTLGYPWNANKETALRLLGQLSKRRHEQRPHSPAQ